MRTVQLTITCDGGDCGEVQCAYYGTQDSGARRVCRLFVGAKGESTVLDEVGGRVARCLSCWLVDRVQR